MMIRYSLTVLLYTCPFPPMPSLPGRPPWLTGLVNHLHNINGETFVTSNAGLTQHLFSRPQDTTAKHVEGVRG